MAKVTVTTLPSIEAGCFKIVSTSSFKLGNVPVFANASILALIKPASHQGYQLRVGKSRDLTSYHKSVKMALRYYAIGNGFNYE